jgi:hypothetical protein
VNWALERFYGHLREVLAERFMKFVPDSTDIDVMIKGGQKIMDDIVAVMDDVTLCYPPRCGFMGNCGNGYSYKIFEFYVKEYHIQFNTLILGWVNNPGFVRAGQIIDLGNFLRIFSENNFKSLGLKKHMNLN